MDGTKPTPPAHVICWQRVFESFSDGRWGGGKSLLAIHLADPCREAVAVDGLNRGEGEKGLRLIESTTWYLRWKICFVSCF